MLLEVELLVGAVEIIVQKQSNHVYYIYVTYVGTLHLTKRILSVVLTN